MFGGVYAGTPVPGIPVVLGDVWRAVNFGVAFVLLAYWTGMILSAVRGERRMPMFSAWGMAALAVFTLRAVAAQVERWNTPVVWEGAPTLSIALGLGLANAVSMRRSMDRLAAGEIVTSGSIAGATRSQERHGTSGHLQRPSRGTHGS
jgi:hypothetical protein